MAQAKFEKYPDKYLVVKRDDADLALLPSELKTWNILLEKVRLSRAENGKKDNTYIVVNEDESYAPIVWKLIELSQTNPASLTMLVNSLTMAIGLAQKMTPAEKKSVQDAVKWAKENDQKRGHNGL